MLENNVTSVWALRERVGGETRYVGRFPKQRSVIFCESPAEIGTSNYFATREEAEESAAAWFIRDVVQYEPVEIHVSVSYCDCDKESG